MPKKGLISKQNKMIFANRLKTARKRKGLSQLALLNLIPECDRVSEATFCKYEKGDTVPSDKEVLSAIAAALDVSVSYLTGDSAYINGQPHASNKVGYTKIEKQLHDININNVRRFIMYSNSFYKGNEKQNGVFISEIFDTGKVIFYISLKSLLRHDELHIKMKDNNPNIENYEVDALIDHAFYGYPTVSPYGDDNYYNPTHLFDTEDVPEDEFKAYLCEADSIEHYVIIDHRRVVKSESIYSRYRLDFDDFMRQAMDVYSINADMIAAINRHNDIMGGIYE